MGKCNCQLDPFCSIYMCIYTPFQTRFGGRIPCKPAAPAKDPVPSWLFIALAVRERRMTGASKLGWTVQFLVMVGCIPIHGSCHHAYSRLEPQQHSKRSVLVLCVAMACSQLTKAASAASPTAMPRHVCLHKLLCDFFLFFLFAGLTVQVINLIHGFLARPGTVHPSPFSWPQKWQFQWGNEVLRFETMRFWRFVCAEFSQAFLWPTQAWKKTIGATNIYPIVFGISKICLQYIQNRSNYIAIYWDLQKDIHDGQLQPRNMTQREQIQSRGTLSSCKQTRQLEPLMNLTET